MKKFKNSKRTVRDEITIDIIKSGIELEIK